MHPRVLIPLLLAVLPSSIHAQLGPGERFRERPGEVEFSGRMVVRPLQVEALIAAGLSPAAAEARHAGALARLEAYVRVARFPEVDEHVLLVPEGLDEEAFAEVLGASGDYEYVEPDWWCYPDKVPNDPKYNQQWHHPVMSCPAGWDVRTGDPAYVAAFVDTGVKQSHEDLAAALVPGYNSVSGLSEAQGGDVSDINGHGTWVAGCIGAIGDNGKGVTGVAWDIGLMPIRTTNSSNGGAYMSDLTEGARWAADNGAGSVSVSYTGVDSNSVKTCGDYCDAADSVLLWAAGNSGVTMSGWDWVNTVVVGATDRYDNAAWFTNTGSPIDVVAPGVDILSTDRGGGYATVSGTSFSAPLTNGVVAMIRMEYPNLSTRAVRQQLYDSCDDLGPAGEDDTFGHGRVNLENSLGGAFTAMTLTVQNLISGQTGTLTTAGAPAWSTVYFIRSLSGAGSVYIAQLNVTLGISNPVLLGSANADAAGDAVLQLRVPPAAANRLVWLQSAGIDALSNVVQAYIP
ncbi:MAG: S8 family serine peptidase [Planctomycetes bacterium]|nr:S8 family serine peptidase [Planctomycetota bacterium]